MQKHLHILLVDDDEDERVLLESLTREMPDRPDGPRIRLTWRPDFDSALELTAQQTFDLHLVDYRLGMRNGLELMSEWARRGITTPAVLMTGQGNYDLDLAAMQAGAADYLPKDQLTPALLERTIRYALENRRAQDELELRVRERTAQLESEIAARVQMEARFRALTETTSAAIFIVQAGVIRYANPAARFVTGFSPSELNGLTFNRLAHPSYRHLAERFDQAGRWSKELPARFELKILTRTGDERWVDITTGEIDYDGQPASIVTAFDITERDRAEKALQQTKNELQIRVDERTAELRATTTLAEARAGILEAIFASLPSAVVVFDARGLPVQANPAAISGYGFDPTALTRREMLARLKLETPDGQTLKVEDLPITRALRGEVVTTENYTLTGSNGQRLSILVSASPILTPSGTQGGILLWNDVTEREQLTAALEVERAQLHAVVQSAPAAILSVDLAGRVILANPLAEQLIGGAQLTGLSLADQLALMQFYHPDGRPYTMDELILVRAAREGVSLTNQEMLLRSAQGGEIYILGHATPVFDNRGRPAGAIGIFQDITGRKLREQDMERETLRAGLLSHLSQAFAAAGLEIQTVLDTITRHIGQALDDGCILRLVSADRLWLDPVSLYFNDPAVTASIRASLPAHREPLAGFIGAVARTGVSSRMTSNNSEEIKENLRRERVPLLERLPIYSHLVVALRARNDIIGTLSLIRTRPGSPYTQQDQDFFEDLAQRAALAIENANLHSEVKQLASHDALTGQYNRRAFFEIGRDEMSNYHDTQQPLSAIMLDIDYFKDINDQFGHALGDRVLQMVVERMREYIRHTDVLGRYGGDEYAILLPATPLSTAAAVAQRIQEAIHSRPFLTDHGPVQVSVSLGVTEARQEMKDIHALLVQADRALYSAKRSGRNRVEKF